MKNKSGRKVSIIVVLAVIPTFAWTVCLVFVAVDKTKNKTQIYSLIKLKSGSTI